MTNPTRAAEIVVNGSAVSGEALTNFWAKIDKGADDQCWPWLGGVWPTGYGRAWVGGKIVRAHRLALALAEGRRSLPHAKMFACHSCDNPVCCNPSHLRWGTQADNMADASRRGRMPGPRKTHCPKGHPYDAENTRITVRPHRKNRICKICAAEHRRRHIAKKNNSVSGAVA